LPECGLVGMLMCCQAIGDTRGRERQLGPATSLACNCTGFAEGHLPRLLCLLMLLSSCASSPFRGLMLIGVDSASRMEAETSLSAPSALSAGCCCSVGLLCAGGSAAFFSLDSAVAAELSNATLLTDEELLLRCCTTASLELVEASRSRSSGVSPRARYDSCHTGTLGALLLLPPLPSPPCVSCAASGRARSVGSSSGAEARLVPECSLACSSMLRLLVLTVLASDIASSSGI
jgi:hypothetical protein